MDLSIGVLHGCCQNSEMAKNLFRDYVKKIKLVQPTAKFYFIEAQYEHSEKGKMWYRTQLELNRIGSNDIPDSDVIETLQYIENIVREKSINCLIGFSQGGNLVSTYLRLCNNDLHIQRAAIISGYDFPKYTNNPIGSLTSLVFVTSDFDEIVKSNLTPTTDTKNFTLKHEKGHIICTRSSFISNFVLSLL